MLIYQGSFTVFSTYVEVILQSYRRIPFAVSVLHVCGGDPRVVWSSVLRCRCSPRMWRWSRKANSDAEIDIVFSTYVEVILFWILFSTSGSCVLHVCGGDPSFRKQGHQAVVCSPRMWRWSYPQFSYRSMKIVFSTYVEVILEFRDSLILSG